MERYPTQEKQLPPVSPHIEPLRSEQRINELLPRVLSRTDLLTIFVAVVIFYVDVSIVLSNHGFGFAINFYWVIGTLTFLLPGAVVAGQLNRWMPADGSIYVWTHRALGPLWGFFAGFCAWLPGPLTLVAISNSILTQIQRFSVQIGARNVSWLTAPWEQGILVVGVLLLTGRLAILPLPLIMKIAKVVVALYLLTLFGVGLAGVLWLWGGHAPLTSLTSSTPGLSGQSFFLYGVIVLALLGVEIPLNMAAEVVQPQAPRLFLRWGPLLALVAYALYTFGIMVIVPPEVSGAPHATMIALNTVFGTPLAIVGGLILIAFMLISLTLYNVTFARILFVSALDYRLPRTLARVNRSAVPVHAIKVQVIIALVMVCLAYFIGPPLSLEAGTTFTIQAYDVVQAMIVIIWCISMVILFLDVPILLPRFRAASARGATSLIAPGWLLYLCSMVGILASLLGIWATLSSSWNNQLIPNPIWHVIVGFLVLAVLIIGLIGSAYPRLLGALEAQTARARENARLLDDEVKRSKEQLETIFQNTADGIVVQDPSATIIFANKVAAQMWGFSSVEELLHTSTQCADWVNHKFVIKDEQGEPVFAEQFPGRRALRERKNVERTLQCCNADTGQTRWLSIKAQAIFDEHGAAQLVINALTDITERQELELRKNVFISMASHELKTPVTSLKGFTHVLQRRLTESGDVQGLHYLSRMNAQLDRLTNLVSDLLDISRMQTGQLIYRIEVFDADALIREIVETFQEMTPSHRISIEGSIDVQVRGDRDRLGQVLMNLLNNAKKYSPSANNVLVHISQGQENIVASVQDFGIGIEEVHQQRIFERFYQIADLDERTYPGLGIGLYLSSEIIKRHHGKLWVESRKKEGSTFYFTLPFVKMDSRTGLNSQEGQ
jgi:PAS domain S-box-containing protein